MDFYERLGVKKNATKQQIKKAFYKLSKEHHPDKGGNEEEFKAYQEAYEVLSDDERRKAYDEGGDYKSIQTLQSKVRNSLFGYIDGAINSFGFVPEHTDLIGIIRGLVNEDILTAKTHIDNLNIKIRQLTETAKRVKNGELLSSFIDTAMVSINQEIESYNKRMEVFNGCLNAIEDWKYEYREDDEPINSTEGWGYKTRPIEHK